MPPKGKNKTPSKPTKPTPTEPPPPPPNWPPLSFSPNHSLSLTLHPLIPSQILLLPTLLPPALCKTLRLFLSTLPLTTTPTTPKRGEAVRVNDRFQVQDAMFAGRLWSETGLREVVEGYTETKEGKEGDEGGRGEGSVEKSKEEIWGGKEILGLNPNIRIYRYRPGQFFDQHYDESNRLTWTMADGSQVPAKTTWTLLVYLTRCEGGETVFYPERVGRKGKGEEPEPVVVETEPGLGLLHRHGEECMLHEGREVTGGEKWVLRSDLVVRR